MTPLKWVSPTGALLGTFTIPDGHFDVMLKIHAHYPDFEFFDATRRSKLGILSESEDRNAPLPYANVKIRKLSYSDVGECYGILTHTPEEFERIPGCTFSPSAAYVRTLLYG